MAAAAAARAGFLPDLTSTFGAWTTFNGALHDVFTSPPGKTYKKPDRGALLQLLQTLFIVDDDLERANDVGNIFLDHFWDDGKKGSRILVKSIGRAAYYDFHLLATDAVKMTMFAPNLTSLHSKWNDFNTNMGTEMGNNCVSPLRTDAGNKIRRPDTVRAQISSLLGDLFADMDDGGLLDELWPESPTDKIVTMIVEQAHVRFHDRNGHDWWLARAEAIVDAAGLGKRPLGCIGMDRVVRVIAAFQAISGSRSDEVRDKPDGDEYTTPTAQLAVVAQFSEYRGASYAGPVQKKDTRKADFETKFVEPAEAAIDAAIESADCIEIPDAWKTWVIKQSKAIIRPRAKFNDLCYVICASKVKVEANFREGYHGGKTQTCRLLKVGKGSSSHAGRFDDIRKGLGWAAPLMLGKEFPTEYAMQGDDVHIVQTVDSAKGVCAIFDQSSSETRAYKVEELLRAWLGVQLPLAVWWELIGDAMLRDERGTTGFGKHEWIVVPDSRLRRFNYEVAVVCGLKPSLADIRAVFADKVELAEAHITVTIGDELSAEYHGWVMVDYDDTKERADEIDGIINAAAATAATATAAANSGAGASKT